VGDVEMGDDCTVWFNAVVRGDVHFVKIGNRTNVQDNSCIHTLNGKAPCILGDDVTIGHSVTLHGCEIKDGALVGMGATVLDHAVVGEGAIVAAGSVVTGKTVIPPHTLWAGVPAKYIKDVDPAQAEEMNQRIARDYHMYASWYR
jgi:carbonic anhydrase/acetyltransferase-like protein (isoleucine patch superfamily)